MGSRYIVCCGFWLIAVTAWSCPLAAWAQAPGTPAPAATSDWKPGGTIAPLAEKSSVPGTAGVAASGSAVAGSAVAPRPAATTPQSAAPSPSSASAPATQATQAVPLRPASQSQQATTGTAGGTSVPAAAPRAPIAKVTTGSGVLPNDHGQVWREYDISPYTLRVSTTNRPEQAIVDWILRETGYEAWHSEPLAVLSANRQTLRVYHTPEMQRVVSGIVDRFVASRAETRSFSVRLVTVSHPNWRTAWQQVLQPVQVQTPGVQAWLLQKEDAAMLVAELRRRSDYREHNSPQLLVANGQSTVISATRGRQYVRAVVLRNGTWPGFEPANSLIDEGFSLEFSPLLSVDGATIDAVLQLRIDQVEKMVSIPLDVVAANGTPQRTRLEIPQVTQFHFQERFRWPTDQVLLVDLGMVPLPVPIEATSILGGVRLPLVSGPPRGNVLILVESKGPAGPASNVTDTRSRPAGTYRGRY